MDRRVEVGAGMLDDPPPIEIEAVLLEVELLLHLDRHAEKGREFGRHGVGEIDDRRELRARARRGPLQALPRSPRSPRPPPLEEAAPRECAAHRFLTAGNACSFSPWLRRPPRHARYGWRTAEAGSEGRNAERATGILSLAVRPGSPGCRLGADCGRRARRPYTALPRRRFGWNISSCVHGLPDNGMGLVPVSLDSHSLAARSRARCGGHTTQLDQSRAGFVVEAYLALALDPKGGCADWGQVLPLRLQDQPSRRPRGVLRARGTCPSSW